MSYDNTQAAVRLPLTDKEITLKFNARRLALITLALKQASANYEREGNYTRSKACEDMARAYGVILDYDFPGVLELLR
jgi:hypothetical protein